jgi:hypothetical protein
MPVEAREAASKGRLIEREMPFLRNEAAADYQRLNLSRNACCSSDFSQQSACHGI